MVELTNLSPKPKPQGGPIKGLWTSRGVPISQVLLPVEDTGCRKEDLIRDQIGRGGGRSHETG